MKTAMRLALHFATTTINRVARFRETRFGLSALFFILDDRPFILTAGSYIHTEAR